MNEQLLTDGLSIVGAFAIGFGLFKGVKWLWEHKPSLKWRNPLKTYIRGVVINYLNELRDEDNK